VKRALLDNTKDDLQSQMKNHTIGSNKQALSKDCVSYGGAIRVGRCGAAILQAYAKWKFPEQL
jgi:hypothetical protein